MFSRVQSNFLNPWNYEKKPEAIVVAVVTVALAAITASAGVFYILSSLGAVNVSAFNALNLSSSVLLGSGIACVAVGAPPLAVALAWLLSKRSIETDQRLQMPHNDETHPSDEEYNHAVPFVPSLPPSPSAPFPVEPADPIIDSLLAELESSLTCPLLEALQIQRETVAPQSQSLDDERWRQDLSLPDPGALRYTKSERNDILEKIDVFLCGVIAGKTDEDGTKYAVDPTQFQRILENYVLPYITTYNTLITKHNTQPSVRILENLSTQAIQAKFLNWEWTVWEAMCAIINSPYIHQQQLGWLQKTWGYFADKKPELFKIPLQDALRIIAAKPVALNDELSQRVQEAFKAIADNLELSDLEAPITTTERLKRDIETLLAHPDLQPGNLLQILRYIRVEEERFETRNLSTYFADLTELSYTWRSLQQRHSTDLPLGIDDIKGRMVLCADYLSTHAANWQKKYPKIMSSIADEFAELQQHPLGSYQFAYPLSPEDTQRQEAINAAYVAIQVALGYEDIQFIEVEMDQTQNRKVILATNIAEIAEAYTVSGDSGVALASLHSLKETEYHYTNGEITAELLQKNAPLSAMFAGIEFA